MREARAPDPDRQCTRNRTPAHLPGALRDLHQDPRQSARQWSEGEDRRDRLRPPGFVRDRGWMLSFAAGPIRGDGVCELRHVCRPSSCSDLWEGGSRHPCLGIARQRDSVDRLRRFGQRGGFLPDHPERHRHRHGRHSAPCQLFHAQAGW